MGLSPTNPAVRIIFIPKKVAQRWEPKELAPFSFEFPESQGLREISGFYSRDVTEQELLAILTRRYGPPVHQGQLLGMNAYTWEIGNTRLALGKGLFRLVPIHRQKAK